MNKLFILLIFTTLQTALFGSILTFNIEVITSAIQILVFVWILFGAVGYAYLKTNSLPIATILFIFYNGLIVYTQSSLLFIPLIILSFMFYFHYIKSITIKEILNNKILYLSFLTTILILGTGAYTDFLILEKLQVGLVHKDTLFHSSIASMIKHHATSSTGLNGLIVVPYHILSHSIIASFSILSNISVLKLYGYIPTLFFNPLLIFSIAYSVIEIIDHKKHNQNMGYIIWFIIILILAFLKIFSLQFFGLFDSYWSSESYTLSLILLLFIFPLMLHPIITFKNFITISIMILLIGLTKASVGLVLLGLFGVNILIFNKKYILSSFVTAGAFYYLIIYSIGSSSNTPLYPLDFIIHYSLGGNFIEQFLYQHNHTPLIILGAFGSFFAFLLFHFIFTWIALGISIKEKSNKFSLSNIYIISSFLFGLFIVSLFKIAGGSVYYFTNVTMFISLPFIVIWIYNNYSEKLFLFINFQYKKIFFLIIILFIATSSKKLGRHIKVKTENPKDTLVTKINNIQTIYADKKNIILKKDFSLKTLPTTYSCDVKPFLYVAITEHPWSNILDTNCTYVNYGYSNYLNNSNTIKNNFDIIRVK